MGGEVLVEFADEVAVGVGEHDFDTALGELGEGVPEAGLVFGVEGVAVVGGEAAGGADGVVGWVEVDEILGGVGAIENGVEGGDRNFYILERLGYRSQ